MSTVKTGPIHVGIVACPHFAAIDIVGVYTVFGVPPLLGMRPDIAVHFVGKNLDELSAMPPWPMRATTTFADCPQPLDVLAIGALPPDFMADEEAMHFVATAGAKASYLIGVCGGSLVLGAAGLLKGYRATTNFHMLDQLEVTGAIPTRGHVVVDRNRFTTGPVVGAYDASLTILGELCGPEIARELELHLEHVAEPPFRTGSPELAGEGLTRLAMSRIAGMASEHRTQLVAACERRGAGAA